MKKKAIIAIAVTLVAGFIYFVFPTNSTKMHNIFQQYLEENIADYENYKECLFGLHDGPSSKGGKSYGGFGKYYEIEYCHKQHGIRLILSTDGYEIHDNYDDIKKQIQFIEYAMEIFNERIQDDRVTMRTMSFTENKDYENIKPSKEFVLDHLELFSPEIDVLAENMDYVEFKAIDEKISQFFSDVRFYRIIDSTDDISFNSNNLEEFKKYKINGVKESINRIANSQNIQCCTSKIIKAKNTVNSHNIHVAYLTNNNTDENEIENNPYTSATEQYAYPVDVTVGTYGQARVTVICNVNRSTKYISFHSFGSYTVNYNNSLDTIFSLKSRSCKKVEDYLLLKCTFTLTNVNTHQTSEISTQTKITYNDIKKFNHWS